MLRLATVWAWELRSPRAGYITPGDRINFFRGSGGYFFIKDRGLSRIVLGLSRDCPVTVPLTLAAFTIPLDCPLTCNRRVAILKGAYGNKDRLEWGARVRHGLHELGRIHAALTVTATPGSSP